MNWRMFKLSEIDVGGLTSASSGSLQSAFTLQGERGERSVGVEWCRRQQNLFTGASAHLMKEGQVSIDMRYGIG